MADRRRTVVLGGVLMVLAMVVPTAATVWLPGVPLWVRVPVYVLAGAAALIGCAFTLRDLS